MIYECTQTNVHILVISHVIFFQVYPQTTPLFLHMYINIQSHQHKITKLTWIHILHTFNIYTFDTVAVWSLLRLSANFWVHQRIAFQNWSCHTLTFSFLMVFQNSCNILGIVLHIYCPTSQKYMFYIGF